MKQRVFFGGEDLPLCFMRKSSANSKAATHTQKKKRGKLFPLLILFVVTDVFFFFFLISFYTLHKIWRKVNGRKKIVFYSELAKEREKKKKKEGVQSLFFVVVVPWNRLKKVFCPQN